MAEFRESICIAASHAALPGHFPGQPVVPGVVLLDRVAAALERWRGLRISVLAQVKFLRALLPEQRAELHLSGAGKSIHFSIARDGAAVASGVIEAGQ